MSKRTAVDVNGDTITGELISEVQDAFQLKDEDGLSLILMKRDWTLQPE